MRTSKQLSLGPMPLQSLSGQSESDRKSLNRDALDLAKLALDRAGISDEAAAIDMGISPSLFSRQFNPTNETEHPSLKRMRRLPRTFWREFALLLCEDLGLVVNGPDVERHAIADVLAACSHYVRVMSR